MTGETIKPILEDVADNLFNPDPYYQQGGDMVRVGGMGYTISVDAAMGNRIANMHLLGSGAPIEADKDYVVAGWGSVNQETPGSGHLGRRRLPPQGAAGALAAAAQIGQDRPRWGVMAVRGCHNRNVIPAKAGTHATIRGHTRPRVVGARLRGHDVGDGRRGSRLSHRGGALDRGTCSRRSTSISAWRWRGW